MSLCSVWPSHSHITSLSTAILLLGKARSCREPKLGCRGLRDLGDMMLCQKSQHVSCRMGRRIVMMKLICSLGHFEWDGHTVHKLSQRRLIADWLAPWESYCKRMCSKVSSDWLLRYIRATRPVLEILKMDRYFPDSPCMKVLLHINPIYNPSVMTWRKKSTTVNKKHISKSHRNNAGHNQIEERLSRS
jgi:hypothetical protein